MKKLIACTVIGAASLIGVSSTVAATGDTGWACPSGTVHTYKLDHLSGATFTVPAAPAGWEVLGVSIKAGPEHHDYPTARSGDVITVKVDTGHDTSHAHICKRRTTWETTTTTTSTTTPATTSTTSTTSTTTSPPTTPPGTDAPTTTAAPTTSTSSPPQTSPSTSSSVPGSTSTTTSTAPGTTTTTTAAPSVTTTTPTPSSTSPGTGSFPDPGDVELPATGAEDDVAVWAFITLLVGVALVHVARRRVT